METRTAGRRTCDSAQSGYGQGACPLTQRERDSAARAGSVKKSDRLLRQGNKSMRYKLIDTNKAVMPVDRMCRMMAVSASGYYAWKERRPSLHQCYDVVLSANIRAQFASSNQT